MSELLECPRVQVAGDAAACGRGQGEALGDRVRAFVNQRLRAAKVYLWERGSRDLDAFKDLGRRCYEVFRQWDASGASEHDALAAAADVDAAELYTATNMTDIRDVLLVHLAASGPAADGEGCTALLVPGARSADGALLAAQTWDLNPQDVDDIVAIHRRPDDQPATWTVTCNGCPTLVGINEHGVCVGTTNVKTADARIGVGYLSVLHSMIREPTAAAAAAVARTAPRAAAHTFWAADASEARLLVCSATAVVEEPLGDVPMAQTNHLRQAELAAQQLEEPNSSSLARLAFCTAWGAAAQGVDWQAIRSVFADRSQGVDSVNRYAEDQQGTATDACFIGRPAGAEAWICRGPADRGQWYRIAVADGSMEPVTT